MSLDIFDLHQTRNAIIHNITNECKEMNECMNYNAASYRVIHLPLIRICLPSISLATKS